MAEYVYHFLLHQAEFLMNQTAASGTRLVRSERKSFRLGVLDGFAKKLKSAEKTSANHAAPGATAALTIIGQALAKFRDDPQLEDYLSEVYPRLGSRRESSLEIDENAFAAGHAAGRSITLNKPISSQMGNQGKFLPGSKA